MKKINLICISLSIVLGLTALTLSTPLFSKGTAVIYSVPTHGTNGNNPYAAVPKNFTPRQQHLLSFAYDIAKADGFKHPAYLQGILMQESRGCKISTNFRVAGLTNKPNDRYFGCGQIKLAAAKAVLQKYPDMWKYIESGTDEEIQARLILDDEFNIRISSKYLLMMGINNNPNRAITAYNVGPGAVKSVDDTENFAYTKGVRNFSEKLHKDNIQAKASVVKLKNKHHNHILLARDP
jgi:hypothetical protein